MKGMRYTSATRREQRPSGPGLFPAQVVYDPAFFSIFAHESVSGSRECLHRVPA